MSGDQSLPNIQVGRDASDGDDAETATVEFLDYELVDRLGWELEDDDVFEKVSALEFGDETHGSFDAPKDRYILDAAEDEGYEWPFECRAASCANCAGILVEGEVEMDMDLILTEEEVEERNIVLTCQSKPVSDELKLVYNAKRLDYLQDRVIGVREV